jgi:hypothetical protein
MRAISFSTVSTSWIGLITAVFVSLSPLRAVDFVGENLILTNDADIAGNLSLGTNGSDPGLTFHYADGTTATITMTSSRNAANWEWYHNSGSGTQISMKLDSSNQLIVYNAAGTAAGITLNPTGTSAFVNGITIGSSNVLTVVSGDARYLSLGSSIGSATNSVTVYGTGYGARGYGSYSTAIGSHANANAGWSTALGNESYANAGNSSALGYGSTANGNYSVAVGRTTAQAMSQMVVGQYNILQGTTDSWIATDDLFIVGNGTAANARSNAFVVKKNGNTQVNGDTFMAGKLEVAGRSKIQVEPQGDLSMGEYTTGP